MIFWVVDHLTNGWQSKKIIGFIIFIISGLAIVGTSNIEYIPAWITSGFVIGLILMIQYYIGFRFNRSLIILAISSYMILETIANSYGGFDISRNLINSIDQIEHPDINNFLKNHVEPILNNYKRTDDATHIMKI